MKRMIVTRYGGPEVFQLEECSLPECGPEEVRVKVKAAGVSQPDAMVAKGRYMGVPKPPALVPGYDIVGEVEQVGRDVTGFQYGQTVAAMTIHGGYAEYVCVPAKYLVLVPAGLDLGEAVCMPLNYLTAYQILHRILSVHPGGRILIHGAGGGVGTAMLELGRLEGLEIYGTASAGKHEVIRRLGGTPIDYQNEDFVACIRELTKGQGMDAAIDPFIGDHLWQSYQTLQRGGTLVPLGVSNTVDTGRWKAAGLVLSTLFYLGVMLLTPDGKRIRPCCVPALRSRHLDWHTTDMAALFILLQEGKIKPVISHRLPLVEARQAHELLRSGKVAGRIVLSVGA